MADMALSVSSALDIVISLGIEAAVGDSDLEIKTSPNAEPMQVGTIARIRSAGEVGIRISF